MKNTWNESVKRGKALMSQIGMNKWELGDLTIKECPANDPSIKDGGRLEKFADEIGISVGALRKYRTVAAAWPAGNRFPAQTWTTHMELAGQPDREQIMAEQTWTRNALRERLGQHPYPARVNYETGEIEEGDREITEVNFVDTLKDASPEVKREVFTSLAEDDEVTDDNRTRGKAERKLEDANRRSPLVQSAQRQRKASEAAGKKSGRWRFSAINRALSKAKRLIKDAQNEADGSNLDDEHREFLTADVADLKNMLDRLQLTVDATASPDWNAGLQEIIEGK